MRSRRRAWRLRVTLVLLVGWAASALAGPISEAAAQGRWMAVGSLDTARRDHTATLLASGQVLVAGGFNFSNDVPTALSSAELYDPATGKWTPTEPLNTARTQHTATLLPSGQVLVAGGFNHPNDSPTDLSSAELYDPATGQWTSTGALNVARSSHTATLLLSGQVLVVGGGSASAELYDPASGKWTRTGSLNTDRDSYTATLLPSGQVLVAGGSGPLSSAELYDPVTGKWTPTLPLGTARMAHTATLLRSGQVLVAGGFGSNENLQSAELYDPATGRWTSTGDLGTARSDHTATLLPSGQVLIAGGSPNCCPGGPLAASELYDHATGKWTSTGPLSTGRNRHTATLLPSGQVLVAGGDDTRSTVTNRVELYEPAIGRWMPTGALGNGRQSHTATLLPSGHVLVSGGQGDGFSSIESYAATGRWTPTRALGTGRAFHTATLLPSGQVLVAGGLGVDLAVLTSAELFDPATGRWTAAGALGIAREGHTATLLPSGQVLVAGGFDKLAIASAELYDLATGQWTATGALGTARESHTATLLPSGQVLVAGGQDGNNALSSTELYDPATGRWTATGALGTGRALHTATLLPSGRVLVAGGGGGGKFLSSAELYDPATGRWAPTSALGTGRSYHAATLLPSGQVLVTGGGDGSNSLSSAERYDPATGQWTPTGSLGTGRALHTATLLPSGGVLVAGGVGDIGTVTIAEIYEPGPGFQAARRPNLTFVGPAAVGSALGVEGSLFLGFSETAGGGTQQSATNYPLVQLRRLDSEQTRFLPSDPFEPWTDSTFTSLPLSAFPPGPALVTVFTNGIPSVSKSIVVHAKTFGARPPEPLRLGPVHVRPRQVSRGEVVEVVTTLRAGGTAVPRLTVFFYDGDPEAGGQVFRIRRVGSLGAHEAREVHVSFEPARCGTYQLVVIAGEGTPFEAERTARPLHVDCGLSDRR